MRGIILTVMTRIVMTLLNMTTIRVVDDTGIAKVIEISFRHVQKLTKAMSEFKALDYYSDHRFHKSNDLLQFIRSRNVKMKPSSAEPTLTIY